MMRIKFVGTAKQLRAFLEYLQLHWGRDRRIVDIPCYYCR